MYRAYKNLDSEKTINHFDKLGISWATLHDEEICDS